MHEILQRLSPGDRVLDLGCASGSFREESTAATVYRADLERSPGLRASRFVCCDARSLPFTDGAFHAAILNHSLEHFESPDVVLAEIRRVVRAGGYFYVAVPDASTITDRLYRWLARGGGHVNQFHDPAALARRIEQQTGLPYIGMRLLFTSLSFMNSRNITGRKPRRMYLVGGGAEPVLRIGVYTLRRIDSLLGRRLSIYGWAFFFGPSMEVDGTGWSNVCVRCGSGTASIDLLRRGAVRRGRLGLRLYKCGNCGAQNYFTDDVDFR